MMKSVSKKANLFAASRFVLPEHREMYLEMQREQALVPPPIVAEDERERFDHTLSAALQRGEPVTVRYWVPLRRELGEIRTVSGWVKRVDAANRRIKLGGDEEASWIAVNRIVDVSGPESG